jgi:hypothetical protein
MRKIYRHHSEFNRAIELLEREAKESKWGNSEGVRVIAKYKYGAKVSKQNGHWHKIVCVDEKKFMWLLLKV